MIISLFIVFIPRMWEYLVNFEFNICQSVVHPTYVGISRKKTKHQPLESCLSHICGNVSLNVTMAERYYRFIPRMWECLGKEEDAQRIVCVYPTCVGMSQHLIYDDYIKLRLFHVCGNVSKTKFRDKRDDLKAEQIMPRFFHTLCRSITFFFYGS